MRGCHLTVLECILMRVLEDLHSSKFILESRMAREWIYTHEA